MKSVVTIISLLLLCCGCRTYKLYSKLAPDEPPFLKAYRTNANSNLMNVKNYKKSPQLNKVQRNDYINDAMTAIDFQFADFLQLMGVNISGMDTLGDIAVLATQLAAAGVPAAGTKTIFSLIGSGLTGSRLAAQKNYFAEKSAVAIYAKMFAYKNEMRIYIKNKMTNTIETYPLSEAIRDMRDYHAAGSITVTTTRITAEAGASLVNSQTQVNSSTNTNDNSKK